MKVHFLKKNDFYPENINISILRFDSGVLFTTVPVYIYQPIGARYCRLPNSVNVLIRWAQLGWYWEKWQS